MRAVWHGYFRVFPRHSASEAFRSRWDCFIATTVELLTTGVAVPIVFYQMVGRGTRLHAASGKLIFRWRF
jgi:hypothetical protein